MCAFWRILTVASHSIGAIKQNWSVALFLSFLRVPARLSTSSTFVDKLWVADSLVIWMFRHRLIVLSFHFILLISDFYRAAWNADAV